MTAGLPLGEVQMTASRERLSFATVAPGHPAVLATTLNNSARATVVAVDAGAELRTERPRSIDGSASS
ncbi:MAG: hypothetical protein R2705_10810 [Ilumatobacteraceae bacterium]